MLKLNLEIPLYLDKCVNPSMTNCSYTSHHGESRSNGRTSQLVSWSGFPCTLSVDRVKQYRNAAGLAGCDFVTENDQEQNLISSAKHLKLPTGKRCF